jgi:hypothetical protein
MRDSRVRSFMWSLGYSGCYAVNCDGLSGGLALVWLSSVSVLIKPCNARCIDVHITLKNGIKWRATFVYGEPRRERRSEFWDFLCFMRAQWDGPWICCGDFNEVLNQDEHFGPRERTDAQISAFRDCLQDCELMDLGFEARNIHEVTDKAVTLMLKFALIELWQTVIFRRCLRNVLWRI